MARSSATYVNVTNSTIGASLFTIKECLKSVGWTVPSSSDGTTYNSSGDQITHNGTGAGGFENSLAWCRLQDPSGLREITFQRQGVGAGNEVRVKYSAAAKFVGGTPGATQTPSATDGQILIGGGTDASPTTGALFSASTRVHCVADSTPVGGVYPVHMFCTALASSSPAPGALIMEPMAVGSYDAGDVDPVVIVATGNNPSSTLTAFAWFAYGTGGATWVTNCAYSAGPYNGALGIDPVNGKDTNGRPTWSGSVSGSTRIKGISAFGALRGQARTYPATANTATDAYAYIGLWALPYPNNTIPSVS